MSEPDAVNGASDTPTRPSQDVGPCPESGSLTSGPADLNPSKRRSALDHTKPSTSAEGSPQTTGGNQAYLTGPADSNPSSRHYENDPRYCGAVTTYDGKKVVCWRSAGHDGDHQGEVIENEETYSWIA